MTHLSHPEDLQWLFDTHLKDLICMIQKEKISSAIFYGNEDCPTTIELFTQKEPLVKDYPRYTFTLQDNLTYTLAKEHFT